MKRLLTILFALLLTACALSLPPLLSDWQNRQYLQKTERESLPEVVAVRQQLTNAEKIELYVAAQQRYFIQGYSEPSAIQESPAVQVFTQYPPQADEMNLTEAITKARGELAKLEQAGACPKLGEGFAKASVQSSQFSKVFDVTEPSRQISVWEIRFAWEDTVCDIAVDATDAKLYSLQLFLNELNETLAVSFQLDQVLEEFASYHGVTFAQAPEYIKENAEKGEISGYAVARLSEAAAVIYANQQVNYFGLSFSGALENNSITDSAD